MSPDPSPDPRRVVIAGGGIAALEALLVLTDLGEKRLQPTLVCNRDQFVLRPQMIGEPWGGSAVRADLRRFVDGVDAKMVLERLVAVAPENGVAIMASGTRIEFDDLIVAVGADPTLPYTGAQTIGFGTLPDALAAAAKGSVAIIVPPRTRWTLPAYQLALHIAAGTAGHVKVITHEQVPMQAFGVGPARVAADLIVDNGVSVEHHTSVPIGSDVGLLADTVLALPLLRGPAIGGLPANAYGFHQVDQYQRCAARPGVYVVGDATTHDVKQGGLAAQQADVAAAHIASRFERGLEPDRYRPVLRGKLVAPDGETLYMRRSLDSEDPGDFSDQPLWQPAGLLCARRLSRWLDQHRNELDGDPLEPLAHSVRPGRP